MSVLQMFPLIEKLRRIFQKNTILCLQDDRT